MISYNPFMYDHYNPFRCDQLQPLHITPHIYDQFQPLHITPHIYCLLEFVRPSYISSASTPSYHPSYISSVSTRAYQLGTRPQSKKNWGPGGTGTRQPKAMIKSSPSLPGLALTCLNMAAVFSRRASLFRSKLRSQHDRYACNDDQ